MNKAMTEAAAMTAAATLPGFSDITQVSVITPDAKGSIRRLGDALGVGTFKFVTLRPPALFNTTFGDGPGDGSMRAGLTWIGNVQLEVIEPLAQRNVYADYLERRHKREGVEHIFLKHAGISYEHALRKFKDAGYVPKHHSQLNAAGRFGVVPVPALPKFLAPRLATRFCYTSTQDELKVDIELAQFAFGISQRIGLRLAIADEWIPPLDQRYFEDVPSESVIRAIDAVFVLGSDIGALVASYRRLTDKPPSIEDYAGDVLPGRGKIAAIALKSTSIFLVEPQSGPVRKLLTDGGEGIQIVRGRAMHTAPEAALRAHDWTCESVERGVFATHPAVPFALLLH